MKVALIQAPFWGIKSPPLGLACLSAYLRERGYQVYKRDLNIETYSALKDCGPANLWNLNQTMWGDYKQVSVFYDKYKDLFNSYIDDILAADVEVVGFEILWSTEIMSRLIASEIKKRDPIKTIIFGGPQCAAGVSGERLVALPEIDYVIHGEGEEALYELLEAKKAGKPITGTKSVFSKTEKFCGERPLIKDLNSLPFPDFDDFRLDLYAQPTMLAASTSRGCPNHCIYCDEKIFWHSYRSYTGDRIFAEIQRQVKRYGVRRFEFTDSLVNGNVKSLQRFCELVIENKLDISWMGQATMRREMTEELLQKIKDSGCFHLCFGMEHSSPEFMFKMGKKLCKDADFDQFVKDCYKSKLALGLNWMFGFPGETDEIFQGDLDFFTRNAPYFKNLSVNNSPGFCGFSSGCYAYNHPEELGIILGSDACSWKSKDGTNTYVTRLQKYQKFCRHLDSLKIKYSFPEFKNENECIGDYYLDHEKDYNSAMTYYKKELMRKECSPRSQERFIECYKMLGRLDEGQKFLDSIQKQIKSEAAGKADALKYLYLLTFKAAKILLTSPRRLTVARTVRGWRQFKALQRQESKKPKSIKSKYDLMLIQAPGWGVSTPPLALAMLTAYVRQKGYDVLPIDLNCEFYLNKGTKYKDTWELSQSLCFWNTPFKVEELLKDNVEIIDRLMDLIVSSNPSSIGFTIYASSVHVSLYIARKIKAFNSNIKIIFGGPHASRFMHGKLLAMEDCVDVVAQGEGEWILGEFLRRLKTGKDIYSIPGTLVKKNGIMVDNGDSESIKNLDNLPYVDFSDYNFSNYREPFKLPIMSSRGCVNRCIFCNERPYWRTYRSLTAKRIFSELKYQLESHPGITWLDFQDSVVNGNVRELEKFADLIIEKNIKIQWSGQAIIHKEMVPPLLSKLKKSGCVCLAYGLETPSASLMLKVGKVVSKGVDIDKMVKDCADAGLTCAYNFMFGLPGETEDDANCTLEFLRRNKNYLATVNPSPCFCGFSPGTLGYENPQGYGLDFSKGQMYWETDNGTNNYLVRLERFEKFCRLVQKLGIPTTYPNAELLDRDRAIGNYYYAIKEYDKASESLKKWLQANPQDKEVENSYNDCLAKLNKTTLPHYVEAIEHEPMNQTNIDRLETCSNYTECSPIQLSETKKTQYEEDKLKFGKLLKLGSPKQSERDEILEVNARLNDYEYSNGLTELCSYPKYVIIGTYSRCNAKCIFCLGDPGASMPEFSLELFKNFYEKKTRNALISASRICFCGFGEPLTIKGIREFIYYLNEHYPCPIKSFTTNGIGLNLKLVDAFVDGRYTLQISLHASRSDLHKQLTKTSTFDSIIKNLEYARSRRDKTGSKMGILLTFVVNTLNVRDIPEFVKLAIKLGVDQVKFDYMTIYTKEQMQYSCFFDKELTNEMFEAARSLALDKIDLQIPPLFNSETEAQPLSIAKQVCKDPWDWVYFSTVNVNYCCAASQSMGSLQNKTFEEIWNSEQYQNLRRSLVSNTFNKLCEHCMRGQSFKVNDFSAHVTARYDAFKQITEEYKTMTASFTLCNCTDINWIKGVARTWATAFFVPNSSETQNILSVGKKLELADGSVRTIIDTKVNDKSLIVFLDGEALDGDTVGYPNRIKVVRLQQISSNIMADNKNKILFVMVPKIEVVHPPMTVPCLSAYLRERGWDVSVYDLNIECYLHRREKYLNHWSGAFQEFWGDDKAVSDFFNAHTAEVQKMFDFIEKENPSYIGFSTWLTNFSSSLIIAREIKKRWPGIKLIFGGALIWQKFHLGRLDLKDHTFIDAFVIGEGEATLDELLRLFKKSEDISQCPGVAFFQKGKLQFITPRDTFVSPKDLPMPDFSGFNLKKYTTQGKQLPFYTSRGCVNKCIFCEERKFWKTYRTKSGEQIFNEIKQAKEQYPDLASIYFSESLTNGNINELRKLCILLVEAGITISWEGNAVIRKEMDRDLLKLMAKAGCQRIMYGVETVSPKLLAYVGKVMSKEADIEKIVKDSAEAGIGVTLNFMFGLPGETEKDAQENIDFVIRNKKYIHGVYPSWSFCYLIQLCDAYADPGKWGLKPITDMSFWESIDGSNTYPVRLERFERFCSTLIKEGVPVQYSGDKLVDREKKLGYYYGFKKDYWKAAAYLLQAAEKEPWDMGVRSNVKACCQKVIDEIDTVV